MFPIFDYDLDKTLQIESMYDHHFDVLGIRVVGGYKYKESIELEEGIILDFDENNVPVALEILDASKVFKIPEKYYLTNRAISMNICVSKEIIAVHLKVLVDIHDKKETMPLDLSTINDIDAPIMNTKLATA
ncbi:MAG: DUF2283 domain-containing protein [Methanobrevibacter sp.]|nr:DUF2283 domain-containing protein [Candidatus Methanovirga procula]